MTDTPEPQVPGVLPLSWVLHLQFVVLQQGRTVEVQGSDGRVVLSLNRQQLVDMAHGFDRAATAAMRGTNGPVDTTTIDRPDRSIDRPRTGPDPLA